MEITEKTKQSIAIGIGTTTIVSIGGILGYWYYKKIKQQAKIDKLATEGEKEYLDEREMSDLLVGDKYGNNRINKDRIRSRFEVYGSNYNAVSDRFKILETDTSGTGRGTKRLRTSGERYKRTPSGYNKNNRNVNFADLGLGD